MTVVRTVRTMGTVISITARPGPAGQAALFEGLAEARHVLERADAVFSTWKAGSPLSRFRRGELALGDAPAELATVLERCRLAREITGGWFDPWAAPGGVDPTGLVKGWAVTAALDALVGAGAEAAIVNAGGDAALRGVRPDGQPWRIGIQSPFDRSALVAVAEPGPAVATSGCYERGRHIFDPFRRLPAARVASATVTGPELDLADAMATALVAGGGAALAQVETAPGFEALLVGHDGRLVTTAGFPRRALASA